MNSTVPVWSAGWRAQQINELKTAPSQWDLLIVGGGITGAGVYREATRLGLKVLLLEQQDFAWGTSSRSSKMVHGGLRYLGSGQFGLARDSVNERQKLLAELPGLVDPLPFLMGHYKGKFPGPWIFDKLLAIYDWMAGRRYRQFVRHGIQDFLAPGMNSHRLKGATRFFDAVTDDARLVLRVLHEGNADGGTAINYLKAVDTVRESGQVTGLKLQDQLSGEQFTVSAKVVVNATGAWTDTLRQTLGQDKTIRPLRGSHLVLPFWRLPVAFSISFFHGQDRRPVFIFPWEGVTVVGTTDLDHGQDLAQEAAITPAEIDYLLAAAKQQFPESGLTVNDIQATWAGVRPVVSSHLDADAGHKPSSEKREHAIWDDNGMISVAGGKLTTFRLIALDVLRKALRYLPTAPEAETLLDTSHFDDSETTQHCAQLSVQSNLRLRGRYGRHAASVMAQSVDPLSPNSGLDQVGTSDTLWSEVVWSCQFETVQHLDDLLLRRTRLGLLLAHGGAEIFEQVRLICEHYLQWDESRWQQELERYRGIIKQYYSVPGIPVAQERPNV